MFHSETPLRDTPAARLAVMHAGLLSRISAALLMGCTYARARVSARNYLNCEIHYQAVKDSRQGLRRAMQTTLGFEGCSSALRRTESFRDRATTG